MSKAFNKVWYEILIFKLRFSGAEGHLLKPIANYLRSRQQRVILIGQTFSLKSACAGVPQSSDLRTFLFLIYMNDLPDETELICTILKIIPRCFLLWMVANIRKDPWKRFRKYK